MPEKRKGPAIHHIDDLLSPSEKALLEQIRSAPKREKKKVSHRPNPKQRPDFDRDLEEWGALTHLY
jgi:hypothetical protein